MPLEVDSNQLVNYNHIYMFNIKTISMEKHIDSDKSHCYSFEISGYALAWIQRYTTASLKYAVFKLLHVNKRHKLYILVLIPWTIWN